MLLLEQNAIIFPGQNGSFLFCHYLLLLGCFLNARKRLGRDHWIQIPKVSWHFIADGLMEKSPWSRQDLLGWLQNLPNANIDISECAVGLFHQNVKSTTLCHESLEHPQAAGNTRSWMPPKISADIGHFNLSKGWHIQQRPECPVGLFCIGHTLDFRSLYQLKSTFNFDLWPKLSPS